MIKPKILSDEEIAKAKNPILQESWVDFGQYVRGVIKEERAVAQAQNDYCYKEMLGQFKTSLEKIAWGTPPFKGIGNIDITGLEELIKALQSQLEE